MLCELRKVYPGSIATTDRIALSSATAESRSYLLRNSPRSYQILVLNSDLDVPLGSEANTEPSALAARLNELIEGKAAALPTIPLREPSYGLAMGLFLLGVFLAGLGALVLRLQLLKGTTMLRW